MAATAPLARTGDRVPEPRQEHSIDAVVRGEPAAMAWFVRAHAPRVQRLLVRVLGPRQDLEDLVQTTFLEALTALPSFERRSELSTFLLGIAVHVARRAMRPRKLDRLRVAVEAAGELTTEERLDERASGAEALRRPSGSPSCSGRSTAWRSPKSPV